LAPGLALTPGIGELAAFLTAVCWSFTAILFGYSGRLVGSRIVNRSRLLFALIILLISHRIIFGSFLPIGAGPERWGWLALSSLLGLVIGDAALFQAYVLIGPRLGTLMMSLVPIMSTIFGWLLFRETVSPVELTGILMAVGGVSWVVTEGRVRSPHEARVFRQGLMLGFVGAFGQAANLLTAKYGLVGGFPAVSATVIRILVATVVMWTIAIYGRQVRPTIAAWGNRPAMAAMLGGAVVGPVIGISLSMVAIQYARIGIAATLMALPPVLLIPIEFVLFGHRVSGRGVFGTLLAFTGVALIVVAR
jgi:drug/metabolite transporter (DMT)-like permease